MTMELLLLAVAAAAIVASLWDRTRADDALVATFPIPLSPEQMAVIKDILRNRPANDPIVVGNGGIVYRLNGPYPDSDASG